MFNCGDSEGKRKILKEIDEDFDIIFCLDTEHYLITHKGFPFQKVAWDEFTREVIDHIKKVVYINKNGNIADEVDKYNAKTDSDKDKKIEDMAHQMAKDIRKPLIKQLCGA